MFAVPLKMQRQTNRTLRAMGLCAFIASSCSISGFLQLSFIPLRAGASAQQALDLSAAHSRRAVVATVAPALMAASGQLAHAEEKKMKEFKRLGRPQFIAALGDPAASSGTGAQNWGLWRVDPGPRGVDLGSIARVKASGGVAPAQWKFDDADWYVEEHGLIMEKPTGGDGGSGSPVLPGQYVVTGDREVTTVLTVFPADKDGDQRWELVKGKLYDVTHLPCRTGRYTGPSCSPANARQSDFPVAPGAMMPPVEGCNKLDYAVLFVVGLPA